MLQISFCELGVLLYVAIRIAVAATDGVAVAGALKTDILFVFNFVSFFFFA